MFDAGLAVIPAQGRVLVVWGAWGTVGLAAHDREPRPRVRDGACTRGDSLSLATHCIALANPVGGVPSRVRPIRRFSTPPTQPVRGPAPGLPPGRRQTRVLPSPDPGRASRAVPAKDRKGAYSHTHSAGFSGMHAGSDECYVFVCESRPVKLWGLCIGAAARGREVPLTEVHRD